MNNTFDGDAMNFTLHLDQELTQAAQRLAPHHSLFDFDTPRKVSGNLFIPKQVVATIGNAMRYASKVSTDQISPEKLEKMKAFI